MCPPKRVRDRPLFHSASSSLRSVASAFRRSELPNINTMSFDLRRCNLTAVESWLAELTKLPLDDVPLVRDHAHLASLVGQSLGPVVFRVEDDPRILGVWQSVNTAAVVYTLWRKTLRFIDMLFVDQSTIIGFPCLDCLTASEVRRISHERWQLSRRLG